MPSLGLATPNRLYVVLSTRAITDQTRLLPAQNWALLEGKDATRLPGIHANVDQSVRVRGEFREGSIFDLHSLDKYGLRTARG